MGEGAAGGSCFRACDWTYVYSVNTIFVYASGHMCTYEYPSVVACLLMRLQLKPRAGGR